MKKYLLFIALLAIAAMPALAQHGKIQPNTGGIAPSNPKIAWPGKAAVPPAAQPLSPVPVRPQPQSTLHTLPTPADGENIAVTRGENGMPIFFAGKTAASVASAAENKSPGERALDYCASLRPQGLTAPAAEFVVKTVQTDELGDTHVRLEQVFNGLPVWGGELICHSSKGVFERMNGRYFPTPQVNSLLPAISAEQAMNTVKNEIGLTNIHTNWSTDDLKLIDGQPFSARLVIFHPGENLAAERLCWHVAARPNLLSRSEWLVDAHTGEVLDHFEHTCNLLGHIHAKTAQHTGCEAEYHAPSEQADDVMPATVNGTDLLGVNRSFTNGGWLAGGFYYLEDASKPMFNSGASNMPGDPVGVIVTLDAFNTSPEVQNFNVDLISSSSPTFSNRQAAISAHYNSIKSFDYFSSKHGRNSIDGVGGNVIGIVNVSEPDGTSMENAFWNGAAMFYGNGGSTFRPLARGLDVGGHEMTHGVIEKTANLLYQGESGALNESFADVFGQMIDGDANDWKIGEDVMQSGGGLPSALRDMSNPHNGQPSNSPFWQPEHTSEQYTGNLDNGGVHINSGIVNRAYYLFATNAAVGTTKAEQVYYKALRDYLVKSSKFIDCRIAVIQAATDLHGANSPEVAAAANAFTTVGIGSNQQGGNYLGQLSPNPGTDYVLVTSNDGSELKLVIGATGQVVKTLYNQGVQSRPSITDNGASLVFVNGAGHIIGIDLNYTTNPPGHASAQLSNEPEWRSAAISKDGRFVAGLAEFQEPRIYIFDLASPFGDFETFFLYNPTYSQGQITGDVEYADVLEFDYSGTFLMYDAYNSLDNIGYWDIGFVQFWENDQFTDGGNAFITKLFSGLPEKVGIGNPTIAKNSPYIIAFDLIDESVSPTRYDIYGANSETGDYDIVVGNNGNLGWPNYNRLDSRLMYEKLSGNVYDLRLQPLNASKIQPQGASLAFVDDHYWGVWYGNGTRSLMVNASDPADAQMGILIAPNPANDLAQLTLQTAAAIGARISLHNLLGETLSTRSVQLAQGENRLDISLQQLPAGNYIVRISTDNGALSALKIVKN